MECKLFEKDIERKTVFKGKVFDIDSATVELPWYDFTEEFRE